MQFSCPSWLAALVHERHPIILLVAKAGRALELEALVIWAVEIVEVQGAIP